MLIIGTVMGAGGGVPTNFNRAVSGRVVARSWNEPSTTSLGSDWSKDKDGVTTWQIANNGGTQMLRWQSNSANRNIMLRYVGTGSDVTDPFVQADAIIPTLVSSNERFGVRARRQSTDYSTFTHSSEECVHWASGDAGHGYDHQFLEVSAGTPTVISSAGSGGDHTQTFQVAFADSLQQVWKDGGTATHAATDATHNGESGFVTFFGDVSSGITGTGWLANTIICDGRIVTVSGLPTGYKAKILNGSGSVIASATESGGTALINATRYQEVISAGTGCTETVPIDGFPKLRITDGSDVEQDSIVTAIWPGDSWTWTAP